MLKGHEAALGKDRKAHGRAQKALRSGALGGEMPQQRQLRHGEGAVHLALKRAPDAHELLTRGEEPRGVPGAQAAAVQQRTAEGKLLSLARARLVRAA